MNQRSSLWRWFAVTLAASVFLGLAACDTAQPLPGAAPTVLPASTTIAATGTGQRTPPATTQGATQPALASPTSAAACASIATTDPLQLTALPGTVRVPIGLAQLGDRFYVAGRVSQNIGMIKDDKLQEVAPIGDRPLQIVADETRNQLYVLNDGDRSVRLFEGGQIRATLVLSSTHLESYQQLEAIALDAAHQRLFALLSGGTGELVVVDTQTFTISDRIMLPTRLTSARLVLDPSGNRIYLGSYDHIEVLELAARRITQSIQLPYPSYRLLALEPTSGRLFVDQYNEGPFIGVVDNGRIAAMVPVGSDPNGAVVLGTRLYVSNGYSHTVSVLDTVNLTNVATVEVGLGPRALAVDRNASRVLVALEGSYDREVNRIEVIDPQTNTVTRRIPLMAQPSQLLADEARGRLFALMPSQGTLLISDGQRVLHTVLLERAPMQMALDERSGRLYVTDSLTGRLSVINGISGTVLNRKPLDLPTRANAVAVDTLNDRLVVNNRLFALENLAPAGYFTLTGFTIPYGDGQTPFRLVSNPQLPRLYALASNGVPGSNGGNITYMMDSTTLKQASVNSDRNVSAIVLDVAAQRLYIAALHPMSGRSTLLGFDALNFTRIRELPVPMAITGLALNARTNHLFATYRNVRYGSQDTSPEEHRLAVFDSRTLGRVTEFRVGEDPIAVAVLGDRAYLAHASGGALTVVQDCVLAMAAAPTSTPSPTPYPTFPPTAPPTATATRTRTPIPLPIPPTYTPAGPCRIPLSEWLRGPSYEMLDFRANVGCPVEIARTARMGKQYFQNGVMYWVENTRKIYVVYNRGSWNVYDDRWDDSQPEGGTETPPAANLLAPKRGFGKVWRELLGGAAAQIGWALSEERGIDAQVQGFERGLALRDEVGATFVLAVGGSWR